MAEICSKKVLQQSEHNKAARHHRREVCQRHKNKKRNENETKPNQSQAGKGPSLGLLPEDSRHQPLECLGYSRIGCTGRRFNSVDNFGRQEMLHQRRAVLVLLGLVVVAIAAAIRVVRLVGVLGCRRLHCG